MVAFEYKQFNVAVKDDKLDLYKVYVKQKIDVGYTYEGIQLIMFWLLIVYVATINTLS